jgi:uncharacterized protein YjbI with pentapeptide repeats
MGLWHVRRRGARGILCTFIFSIPVFRVCPNRQDVTHRPPPLRRTLHTAVTTAPVAGGPVSCGKRNGAGDSLVRVGPEARRRGRGVTDGGFRLAGYWGWGKITGRNERARDGRVCRWPRCSRCGPGGAFEVNGERHGLPLRISVKKSAMINHPEVKWYDPGENECRLSLLPKWWALAVVIILGGSLAGIFVCLIGTHLLYEGDWIATEAYWFDNCIWGAVLGPVVLGYAIALLLVFLQLRKEDAPMDPAQLLQEYEEGTRDFREAWLAQADLRGEDLQHATFRKACFRQAQLAEVNLYKADLFGADLREADLRGADLREANLRRADLRRADLTGADLRDAQLHGAILSRAVLANADLTRSDLTEAILNSAKMNNVVLTHAQLFRADLSDADLTGANMRDCSLLEADLSWACLREADLTGACLENGDLFQASLAQAKLDDVNLEDAIMPDGKRKGSRAGNQGTRKNR